MYKELDNSQFDYFIIGSSLSESILSAYLCKKKMKVLHLDISKFYGGDCKNFNLKDLDAYITELTSSNCKETYMKDFKPITIQPNVSNLMETENFRNYNFDFNPKFIYSKSKSTEELSNSHASQYMEFVAMKKILIHFGGKYLTVPCTKSEIVISNDLELNEKQKLLNFIYAVMKIKNTKLDVNTTVDIKKDYEIEDKILQDIQCNSQTNSEEFLSSRFSPRLQALIKLILANIDPNFIESEMKELSLDGLISKIYKFLISLQIYDDTPLLYPQFGSSEFSQSLCRSSAVNGGIFLVSENLSVQVYYNNEHLINPENKKFIVEIKDEGNGEVFNILTNSIICNEIFLNQKYPVAFGNNIFENTNVVERKKRIKRFISFYIVDHIVYLRKQNDGPILYKVPQNDPDIKNSYGFCAFEFFHNSNSAPKDRTLVEVIIHSDQNEDESEFIEKCKDVSSLFLQNHIQALHCELEEQMRNFDKLPVDVQVKIQTLKEANPEFSVEPKVLGTFQFFQDIEKNNYENLTTTNNIVSDLLITKNNYDNIDLDFYYEEAEKIVKQEKWENITVHNEDPHESPHMESNFGEPNPDDLIDELFNSLDLNKK